MTRAAEFDKPVIVIIEADGTGFLQSAAQNDPNVSASIANNGIPELANLPNTLSGWGMAFLELKKQAKANKVVLGMHISAWASSKDIAYSSIELPLQPEVDKVYDFLAPLGLSTNQTGLQYDLLVGDPIDRDSDYYLKVKGDDRWWDTTSTASINSKSFNRYAEWLRLWNVKSQKRWLLWQIPLGNKYHLNVDNNGQAQEGYKDNRVEYFLGDHSTEHLAKFADCGVIGLLFGAGDWNQSGYTNDQDDQGNLYMKALGGNFYQRGGMPLVSK